MSTNFTDRSSHTNLWGRTWLLSCVAREDAHTSGNRIEEDMSPEEMRVMAYKIDPRGQGRMVTEKESEILAAYKRASRQLPLQDSYRGDEGNSTPSGAMEIP